MDTYAPRIERMMKRLYDSLAEDDRRRYVASGSVASGSVASGSVASVASGSVASGSVASGSVASGSVASGSVASGSDQGLRTTFPWVFWGFHGKYKIFI
jgi:hypothetical protein